MAEGYIPIDRVTSIQRLLTTTIAASGNSSWQTESHTVDLSGYRLVKVFVYVVGAMRNSNTFHVDAMKLSGDDCWTFAYWNDGNLGNVSIDRNGTVNISAKTSTFPFAVTIDGYK